MKSKFSQPSSTGSLGEMRRPRTLQELDIYSIERSIQFSSGAASTILIAEDDEDSRFMMRTLLEMKAIAYLKREPVKKLYLRPGIRPNVKMRRSLPDVMNISSNRLTLTS